jgi:hypothetical protein
MWSSERASREVCHAILRVHTGSSVPLALACVLKYVFLLFSLYYYVLSGENAGKKCQDPYEEVKQAALIPVAYTLGTNFRSAVRPSLASVLHWNRW